MPLTAPETNFGPCLVDRHCLEQRELSTLASYAVFSSKSRGRLQADPKDEWRTCFQRDRDRIVHSRAFRRLAHKTQVQPLPGHDHVRTRLTHTLEVAQIGRAIARRLSLNEDLVEAICLAHDLGHPPFGHVGEQTLNELMSATGGFDHNLFTFELLVHREQRRPDRPGLNLTFEVKEGVLKHGSKPNQLQQALAVQSGIQTGEAVSLEAQTSDIADAIAYTSSDLDDLLRCSYAQTEHLTGTIKKLEIYRLFQQRSGGPEVDQVDLGSSTSRKILISDLIGQAIADCVEEAAKNLQAQNIHTLTDVRTCREQPLISLDAGTEEVYRELRLFLMTNFYKTDKVREEAGKGADAICRVFNALVSNPAKLPVSRQYELESLAPEAVVGAYIASMTDRFLLDLDSQLT